MMISNLQEEKMSLIRKINKKLKNIFSYKIHGNFMLLILEKVTGNLDLNNEKNKYFQLELSIENLIMGIDAYQYEICRFIVGAHRFNTIFKTEKEIKDMEADKSYQKKLVEEVLYNIRLRNYGGWLFRKMPLIIGEDFSYFSLPYHLYVMTTYMINNIVEVEDNFIRSFYLLITNKTLSILSLVGDNFIDNSYPICRVLIELFIKFWIVRINPSITKDYERFNNYVIHKNICEQEFDEEFEEMFENRKYKKYSKKHNYLLFGWVDKIDDYDQYRGNKNPYSFFSLINSLKEREIEEDKKQMYISLERYYNLCNGYAHGNTVRCNYALNDYFSVIDIVRMITYPVFQMFSSDAKMSEDVVIISLLERVKNDFIIFYEQFNKRTTKNFEEYYNRLKG